MKYVALLRGINVGGNNKVDMKQLTFAMEKAGFSDVSTYINSGNIFFSSSKAPTALVTELQDLIASEFELSINVLLRDKPSIDEVVKSVPQSWSNGSEMKCDVMFLWDKYDSTDVLDKLPAKSGIDTVQYVPGAIIWKIDRENVTKSGSTKLVGTDLYAHMTVRNINTVRKILERMSP